MDPVFVSTTTTTIDRRHHTHASHITHAAVRSRSDAVCVSEVDGSRLLLLMSSATTVRIRQ
eukprot:scaffold3882_cov164-Amphora_coffeaeformis.AAC.3